MKAQMCFDSKNIGGGGVFRANSSGSSSTPNENGGAGDGSGRKGGKVRKCKRVRRMKRKSLDHMKRHNHLDQDNREMRGEMIKEYLCKLQEIVPFSRKDKRLSKLEVITNAIDYIRNLRQTLGMSPCISSADDISHFSSEANDLAFTQQLPSLSAASLPSSSPPLYSLIPDDDNNCHQQHNDRKEVVSMETSSSSVEITSENCCSHFPQDHHSSWGTVRPALWTISVPCCNGDDDSSSSSSSSTSTTSSMISSSTMSSDKVNT